MVADFVSRTDKIVKGRQMRGPEGGLLDYGVHLPPQPCTGKKTEVQF